MSKFNSTLSEKEQVRAVKNTAKPVRGTFIISGGIVFLLCAFAVSISLGAADINLSTIWNALFHFDEAVTQHQIIWELRLPRIIGAAIVGAAFSVAGALMQGMTRNPLADSGLLGLNAGAVMMLAISFSFFPGLPYVYVVLLSFFGAALGAAIVYGIGSMSRNGLTPIRLVLAGAAVTALLTALSEGIALYFNVGQDMAFWYAGGVSSTRWSHLAIITPVVIIMLFIAMRISKSITILSLGEEVAVSLGERTVKTKLISAGVVVVLAGLAVSVVGAVSFVGLIVPHLTRKIVGYDYRWIIPVSAVVGAVLVVVADLLARTLNAPFEIPIGALISLIGVPFFLYLARKGGKEI
ncbi:ferrichrome ABC transporter permease [Jeotgalicoccus coquinae]|uniref:Probable heme-iron transport system permease protein IsdF n=1 Tax=Jeotgalicoccus coquinae TaxID=709509 RepID=A0A6V7R2E3_9STAP|nr:iron ABC transporter permease [Jeotgalicoccus coquinae]MBB6423528.1 iron complex transport system permease protein [Jeotgalicoccus coquinae]GGE20538.1 ferrichrome ABC transporter permease [Jeotgalicoccus coquinae]CAD2071519.1 Iron-uptake system permease protein FeuB [Jeotgalicoccus coquinae]